MSDDYIDVVFDGPPSHESGRFVEVDDPTGSSISVGEWIDRGDGSWALRLPQAPVGIELGASIEAEGLADEIADLMIDAPAGNFTEDDYNAGYLDGLQAALDVVNGGDES